MKRAFAVLALAAAAGASAELRVTRLAGDGMVIQHGVAVPLWGSAGAEATVEVTIGGRAAAAQADTTGAWRVDLPAMEPGGPHRLVIASDGERLVFNNVLAGDVWICSGQSNMEWVVADSMNAAQEIAGAGDARIRHFKVPPSWAASPDASLAGGAWEPADPPHVASFTAVGYFFARELRRHVDVPIGLINTSWGGSRIEPWMSAASLGLDAAGMEKTLAGERAYEQQVLARIRARAGVLPERDAGLVDGHAAWADPSLDDSGWDRMAVPSRWEEEGFEGMDGIAWYRTSFELTTDEARAGIRLGLGPIDDSDIAWVNGHEVGRTELAWNRDRVYQVPPAFLKPGRNVVAVRVEDTGGGGGIYGAPHLMFIEAAGQRRPLAGTWRFRLGAVTVNLDAHKNQVPTVLYNKMVHPLLPYPIRGILWYQGESNAGAEDAFAYRKLFQVMIQNWRAGWGLGEVPFLFVQLANYLPARVEPHESSWALLRESQSAALDLAHTAQAITVDIGEADDIHPRNKQEVGRRLALAARRLAYGHDIVFSGPVYRRHQVLEGRVVIEFDHVGGGLNAEGSAAGTLRGFVIAGADRRFVPAEATIEDGRVVVFSDLVPDPVAVRYAWADNPDSANLYNREGLPASPFRTDSW